MSVTITSIYIIMYQQVKETKESKKGELDLPAQAPGVRSLFFNFEVRNGKRSPVNEVLREKVYRENKVFYFNRNLAMEYGAPLSILIKFLGLAFNKNGNRTNGIEQIEGGLWFTESPEFIRNILPYMSESQIRNAVKLGAKEDLLFLRKQNNHDSGTLIYAPNFRRIDEIASRLARKYGKESRLSLIPSIARDHDLACSILFRELYCIIDNVERESSRCAFDPSKRLKISLPSRQELAARLPLSESSVRRSLSTLKLHKLITCNDDLILNVPSNPHGATVTEGMSVNLSGIDISPAPLSKNYVNGKLIDPTTKEMPATERYVGQVSDREGDASLSPEIKAEILIAGIIGRGRKGYVDYRMTHRRIKTKCSPNDKYAATVWFEHNPLQCPTTILSLMEAAIRHSVSIPPVPKGGFDPDWHARHARELRFVFNNWSILAEKFGDCIQSLGKARICLPDPKVMYPPWWLRREPVATPQRSMAGPSQSGSSDTKSPGPRFTPYQGAADESTFANFPANN